MRTGTRYELSRVLALAPAPHAYDRCDACVSCVPLLLPLRRRRTRVRCCGAPHCVIGGRRLRALSRPRTWAATSAAPLLLLSAHARLGGAGRLSMDLARAAYKGAARMRAPPTNTLLTAWVCGCVPRAPLHCVVVCRLPQSLRARVNLQCANAVDVLRSLDKSACAARVLCASVHAPPFPVFRPGTGGDAAPRLTVVLWSFDQAPPTATHFSEPPHSVVSRTPADNSRRSHQSPCCRASTSYTSLRAPTLGRVANAC